jgi:hypothetical protein
MREQCGAGRVGLQTQGSRIRNLVEPDAKPNSCESLPVLRGAAVSKPQRVINVRA